MRVALFGVGDVEREAKRLLFILFSYFRPHQAGVGVRAFTPPCTGRTSGSLPQAACGLSFHHLNPSLLSPSTYKKAVTAISAQNVSEPYF